MYIVEEVLLYCYGPLRCEVVPKFALLLQVCVIGRRGHPLRLTGSTRAPSHYINCNLSLPGETKPTLHTTATSQLLCNLIHVFAKKINSPFICCGPQSRSL